MKYKALLTDVDGTLVHGTKDALPTDKVKQAISKAKDEIHIGIATGRPLAYAMPIIHSVSLSGPCIVAGGSQIYDATTERIVWEKTVEQKDFEAVTKIVTQFHSTFYVNEGNRDVLFNSSYDPNHVLGVFVPDLTKEQANILIDHLSNISGIKAVEVGLHKNDKVGVDITHALATKQHGVFEVAKLLGIETHEIIGVGDGYNDFPLLMACGLKVAMGNAVDDLKAIADHVAPHVDDDGLAWVIGQFVLKEK